jgi:hypothetical protein
VVAENLTSERHFFGLAVCKAAAHRQQVLKRSEKKPLFVSEGRLSA